MTALASSILRPCAFTFGHQYAAAIRYFGWSNGETQPFAVSSRIWVSAAVLWSIIDALAAEAGDPAVLRDLAALERAIGDWPTPRSTIRRLVELRGFVTIMAGWYPEDSAEPEPADDDDEAG